MALDFQNYLYSSSPPDFELFTPPYLAKRRRSPPKISTRKFTPYKEDDRKLRYSFQQLQLDDSDSSSSSSSIDSLFDYDDDYGVDVVGLTKCTDRLYFVNTFRSY